MVSYGLFGLRAGLGAALRFLLSPGWREAYLCSSCRRGVRLQADTIASISDRERSVRGIVIVAVLALLGFFVGAEVTLLKQHTYV